MWGYEQGRLFLHAGGVRYQSQKAVGRMERVDTAGGFLDGGGWLLFRLFHQDPLKRSPSRLIRHDSKLSLLIGYGGRADVGAAAGGSDDSSSSLSHCRTVTQHQQLSNTTCCSWGPQAHNNTHIVHSGDSQRQTHTCTVHFCLLTSKMNI